MSESNPTLSDGDLVRAVFDAYSNATPERFAAIVAEDYIWRAVQGPGSVPGTGPPTSRDPPRGRRASSEAASVDRTKSVMLASTPARIVGEPA